MHEGGTTRNAAECLGRLGLGNQTTFISGIGDDEKSSMIKNSLSRAGVPVDGLCEKVGERTAAFSGFLNNNGDFLCGVADMDVLRVIPREHLDSFQFWDSRVVLIDGNIGSETLEYVLSRTQRVQHVIFEPISEEKSEVILQ